MPIALATLVLLPGLLVVRAPWTAVPALSLAFWALSAWWPPLSTLSRGRFTLAALVVFATLLVLRCLPKHEVPAPPGTAVPAPTPAPRPRRGRAPVPLRRASSAVVLAVALAVALPGLTWGNAPGPESAFETAAARVVLWRDAIPVSLEPLFPLAPFGAFAPALATLGADLARLSGGDPAPAVAALVAVAAAAALLAVFALHATWAPPRAAAVASIVGLAVQPWPRWLSLWGPPEALLALAFLLPGVTLAVAHRSRSSAVASGFLLAAGALSQPALALLALLALAPVARAAPHRLLLVAATMLGAGGPGLWRLPGALSWSEAAGVLGAIGPADAAWFATGLLALAVAPLAVAPLVRRDRRIAGALALAAGSLLVARVHGWMAAGQLRPGDRAALERASVSAPPLAPVCAPEGLRDWVPGLAARPAGEPGPWIPPAYRDEWARRPRRECVDLGW